MSPGPGIPKFQSLQRAAIKGTRAGVSAVAPAPAGSLPDWPHATPCRLEPDVPRPPPVPKVPTAEPNPLPTPITHSPTLSSAAAINAACWQYDAARTGQSSEAMWWMKALAPAGLARINSHGFSRHVVAAGSASSSSISVAAAPFSTTSPDRKGATRYPPRPKPPPEHEFTEVYLKGSGPGGQKINKTNSAVQLKHIPTGIVVKCQDTRSREQNRKLAREHLAEKIDDLLNGDQSRSAIVARLKAQKKSSAAKKSRRKHRDVPQGSEQGEEGTNEDDNGALSSDGADPEPLHDVAPKRKVKIQEIRV